MTSFGNIRHYLATTASSKPCFALYVINLVVRIYLFYFKIAEKPFPVLPFFYLIIFCKFTTENILGIKKGITDS